jgi:hypothetical protein
MFAWLRFTIRHPLFPRLPVTPAAEALERHAALAGSFPDLARAARQGARADCAVFVLIDEGAPLPGEAQFEQLWQWFEVPSYVLVVDGKGKVTAYECEARNGLHLVQERRDALDAGAAQCPCGRPGLKVAHVEQALARL